jgi:hypothetical protein
MSVSRKTQQVKAKRQADRRRAVLNASKAHQKHNNVKTRARLARHMLRAFVSAGQSSDIEFASCVMDLSQFLSVARNAIRSGQAF